jgi:multiple sugar transport system substrate-binding protein
MSDNLGGAVTRRTFTGRALAAGASFSALGSLLAACGGDDGGGGSATNPDEPVSLSFWKFVAENDDPVIQAAIKRWNQENPKIQVKFQTFPFNDYTGAKLTTAFAANKGPDVFWISPGAFLNYVNNGAAEPVDDIVDKSGYSDAAVEAVTVDGKMQALPFEQEPVGLYYRRDILEKAGIKPPETWDDLLAAAQELTGGKRKGIFIEVAPGPYQNFTWYPFLWSAGGEVVSPDSKSSALRTPEAASAFDLWGKLVREGFAPSKTDEVTAVIDPLGRGECAMQICGFWAISQLKNNFKDVDVGIVPLPVAPGGEPVTVYGGWTQMINSQGEHVEQAKAFTKWLWVQDEQFPENWACRKGSKFSPRTEVNEGCGDVSSEEPYSVFTDEILPTARAEPRYPDAPLDLDAHRYWDGEEWVADESAAATVVPAPVGELSVQWSSHYRKWLMMYLNDETDRVVLRTAECLTGPWSGEKTVVEAEQVPSLYGTYMPPRFNDGPDIWFTLSKFDVYDVFWWHTSLAGEEPSTREARCA